MKKLMKSITVCLLLVMVLSAAACTAGKNPSKKDGKISVVCTIFPEYDWARNIIGDADNVELTLLLDDGVDLHSYQPSTADIMTITDCDMFVYVGGESDAWVDDVLKQASNPDMVSVSLLEVLGDEAKSEEIVEGMEAEEEEEGEEEAEYDEHVWLSLRHAMTECDAIEAGLEKIDPANAELYRSNLADYKAGLSALDEEYKNAVEGAECKTVLFADRFPFRYLTDDYNLDYYAAFVGCSAETEASFKTILFLAEKVDEYKLPAILTIDGSDGRIAESVKENTKEKNQEILTMDSMQSATRADLDVGVDYISEMKKNLEVLKQALR